MAYIIWALIGAVVAFTFGADARRRAYAPNANSAVFAGAFGAVVGGIVGDGIPHLFPAELTMLSVIGATIGALIFCWAIRVRPSDTDA